MDVLAMTLDGDVLGALVMPRQAFADVVFFAFDEVLSARPSAVARFHRAFVEAFEEEPEDWLRSVAPKRMLHRPIP